MRYLVAIGMLSMLFGRSASATDISSCDQVLANGETGVLVADLTCAPGSYGVIAGVLPASGRAKGSAVIQLSGHTISADGGVLCNMARCTIEGPGTIRDGISGVYVGGSARTLTLRNLTIEQCEYGVGQGARKTILENVAVIDNEEAGLSLYGVKRVIGTNVVVSGNGGWGIKGDDARIEMTNLTAHNNVGGAVIGSKRPVIIRDSVLAGNGFDTYSWRAPKLTNTSCELSLGPNADGTQHTWGLCTND